jgi:hypothetical protein
MTIRVSLIYQIFKLKISSYQEINGAGELHPSLCQILYTTILPLDVISMTKAHTKYVILKMVSIPSSEAVKLN